MADLTVDPTPSGSKLTPTAQRNLVIGGAVAVVLLLVAAVAVTLSGGDDEAAPTPPKRTTTTTSSTVPPTVTTTTQPPTGPVAPLTGLRVADPSHATRPAIAVKVDNLDASAETAVPQSGLPRADVVFEEIVEGNITRLVGVFQSQDPGRVGPVRSARTTDVHLLPQFGKVLFAWSGGNDGVVGAVRSSPALIDLGYDRATSSYARDRSRRAPHNLYVQATELWGRAPAGVPAPPPLFQYRTPGQVSQAGAVPAAGVDLSWGGGQASSPVSWRWDHTLRLYVRSQRGRPHVDEDGTRLAAQNVVVLVTAYGQSPADRRSPEALTVGSGEAFFYTNGRVIHGRWDRPAEDRPATLVADDGAPILLTPGQTWVELPRAGGVATVS